MKTKTLIVAALVATTQLHAQTITNSGLGISGNGKDATTQRYNIDIVTEEHFDGDRHPTVYIAINGTLWQVFAPSADSSAFCQLMNWDGGKWVQYGYIKAKTADGTQFLGGTIFIKTALPMEVISFNATPFYTPKTMPSIQVKANVLVYKYDPTVGKYVPRPDLTIYTPTLSGAIWLSINNNIVSGVFNGGNDNGMLLAVPVPPPGGPGGASANPLFPVNLM